MCGSAWMDADKCGGDEHTFCQLQERYLIELPSSAFICDSTLMERSESELFTAFVVLVMPPSILFILTPV